MGVAGYHVQLVGGPHVDPDDRASSNDRTMRFVWETAEYIRKHVSGVRIEPSIIESCLYDVSSIFF